MKSFSFIVAYILMLFSISSIASESSQQKISFPMSTKNKSVTLEFSGAIYNKGNAQEISEGSSNNINRFIFKVIKANVSKNKETILELWNTRDRSEVAKSMSKRNSLERNASLFRNFISSKLMGYIEYGEYVICYVKHDVKGMSSPYLKTYPLILHNESFLLTNDLSDDFLFSKLSYSLGKFIWLDT